jgi:hypothetical protein
MRSQSAQPHIRSALEKARTHIPRSRVWRGHWRDETHLFDGVKALGDCGPRPSLFVANVIAPKRGFDQDLTTAPSGAAPSVKNFHKAIIGLRAMVTIMILGTRPLPAPTRSWNHRAIALSG